MIRGENNFQHRHAFIGDAPPVILGGIEHRAEVYETANGRRHICFLKEPERATGASSRLGVYIDDTDPSISLLGMIVNKELRGNGAGKAIAQYFLEYAQQEGLTPVRTSIIRKPLVALTLTQAGFSPEPGGVVVGVLPTLDPTSCPRIVPLSMDAMPEGLPDRSQGGKFYEVIDERVVARKFPVFDPYTPTAIHTAYRPPIL